MNDHPLPSFGKIALGGATFGREIDQPAAFTLLDHALDRGITQVDTAAGYSAGASESIIGAWLQARRPRALSVATKAIPPYDATTLTTSIQQSLNRLQVDALELFYLHHGHESITDETLRLLDDMVRVGTIQALGISNIKATQLAALLQRQTELGLARFSVLQCTNNLAVSDLDVATRELCVRYRLAVVTFSPIAAGFLTGKHQRGVIAQSRFDLIPGHQSIYFKPDPHARLDALLKLARATGHPPAHLALGWALRHPMATSVLIGGRTTTHLDQAFAVRTIDDGLFRQLDEIAHLSAPPTPLP
ncbi:aldo/keto reductase [Synoicihabitans lomoniglobus]|uniref:Aldo/keto reductase n=1 Tax=Synoicihabitans lomoniglobus TaxID=2909285 RepID=A0AAF0CM71_9BACT|nr:aldo/keto reductase [Opitutaceae bacterium LMO-M01]WED63708.1 aldo/keto reductase [Opitutaceae bacterium LMO-M01]